MKERPIIFSGPMVKAIFEGRKTQTRRVIKFPRIMDMPESINPDGKGDWIAWTPAVTDEASRRAYPNGGGFKCPYGQPGDRLWVRETWAHLREEYTDRDDYGDQDKLNWIGYKSNGAAILYREGDSKIIMGTQIWAVFDDIEIRWRPPIYMPRWASRITLEITEVRVERLQNITAENAKAEGIEPYLFLPERLQGAGLKVQFRILWDSIYGKKYPWESNPWVWVIVFRGMEGEKCLN